MSLEKIKPNEDVRNLFDRKFHPKTINDNDPYANTLNANSL